MVLAKPLYTTYSGAVQYGPKPHSVHPSHLNQVFCIGDYKFTYYETMALRNAMDLWLQQGIKEI